MTTPSQPAIPWAPAGPAAPGGQPGSRAGTFPVSLLGAPIIIYASQGNELNPGASVTLTPQSPSPVAGFGLCGQVGYEISVSLLMAAGAPPTTMPFVAATLTFYDDDSPTALPVDSITWYLPAGYGAAGVSPCVIQGHGPLRGQYMTVQLTNSDPAVAVTYTVLIRGVSRSYARDDWRWPGGSQVPGYTAPIVASGQGTLLLASVAATVAQGAPATSRLLPLFAGRTRWRINCTGLTTDAAQVTVQTINAIPGSVLYASPGIGHTTIELPEPEISLVRDCALLSLVNAAGPGGGTASFSITVSAQEY